MSGSDKEFWEMQHFPAMKKMLESWLGSGLLDGVLSQEFCEDSARWMCTLSSLWSLAVCHSFYVSGSDLPCRTSLRACMSFLSPVDRSVIHGHASPRDRHDNMML
jgi:hypothetical protein